MEKLVFLRLDLIPPETVVREIFPDPAEDAPPHDAHRRQGIREDLYRAAPVRTGTDRKGASR
jgi:hypothetical protein